MLFEALTVKLWLRERNGRMKKKSISTWAVSLIAVVVCFALAGCTGSNTAGQGSGQASNLSAARVVWGDYTMGIDLATDDPERAKVAGFTPQGKTIKICFKYVSDTNDSGGFVSKTLLDELREKSITLKDASGKTYSYTGSIGDFIMKGDFASKGFAMEDLQPRFSITFDVPTAAKVEDFVLETGDGQNVKLASYISDEYNADHPSK